MRTWREIIRIASLLYSAYLLFIFGLTGAEWNGTADDMIKAVANGPQICQRSEPTRSWMTPGPVFGTSRGPYRFAWQQSAMVCSGLLEEEPHGFFKTFLKTAPHILFSLTGQNAPATCWMKPAGAPTKLYLLNGSMLC